MLKPGVMIYFGDARVVEKMTDAEAGALFRGILGYAERGVLPAFADSTDKLGLLWVRFQQAVDADSERYAETVRKRSYATYTRECKKHNETPMTYSEWLSDDTKRYQVISDDITHNQMISNDIKRHQKISNTNINTNINTSNSINSNNKLYISKDVLTQFTEKGYVVDHMNNNHMDCQITNLEFLKKAYNTAKGQAFDVDSRNMQFRIAVNIFKDFSTGLYQITIGCNDPIGQQLPDGEIRWVNSIKLLYKCDYSIVINDAENILRIYDTEGRIALSNNNSCDVRIDYAPNIQLTEEETKQAFVFRDGQMYMVIGNGHTYLDTVHFDEGWTPPTNA